MEFLDQGYLLPDQILICQMRLSHKTYNEIKASFTPALRDEQVSTVISRSARGLPWNRNMNGGCDPYLCPSDEESLLEVITEAAENFSPLDIGDIVDEASELKLQRTAYGLRFLEAAKCNELHRQLRLEEAKPPSRSWIYGFVSRWDIALRSQREIDPDRLRACSREKIRNFFMLHGATISATPPELFFGADESMLEHGRKKKVVVPSQMMEGLTAAEEGFPHISAMLSHSISGTALPPFVLLSNLSSLPPEIENLIRDGKLWIGSSPKGWMNRDCFLLWTLNFVNFISSYSPQLDPSIRSSKGLLVLDGHSSRGCPAALELLRLANFDVLILPSHTTHLIQMFDVGLAAQFKAKFCSLYTNICRNDKTEFTSAVARQRSFSLRALSSSWYSVCNPENTRSAARATGMHPFDPDHVLESRWVNEGQLPVPRRRIINRLDINNQILNAEDRIQTVKASLEGKTNFAHLLGLPVPFDYYSYTQNVIRNPRNDSRLLSRICPYYIGTMPF